MWPFLLYHADLGGGTAGARDDAQDVSKDSWHSLQAKCHALEAELEAERATVCWMQQRLEDLEAKLEAERYLRHIVCDANRACGMRLLNDVRELQSANETLHKQLKQLDAETHIPDQVQQVQQVQAAPLCSGCASVKDQTSCFAGRRRIGTATVATATISETTGTARTTRTACTAGSAVTLDTLSESLRMSILQWLPASRVCRCRVLSRRFVDLKELLVHLWTGADLLNSPMALMQRRPCQPERRQKQACLGCLVMLSKHFFRAAPEFMRQVVLRIAQHALSRSAIDKSQSPPREVSLEVRATAAVKMAVLLMSSPGLGRWMLGMPPHIGSCPLALQALAGSLHFAWEIE
ncbi:unnamed protein product [Symbiodinium sp. CCMP2592]|nr:unnamed protein product [Symbiodinium sp. CCMP2592]